MRGPYVSPRRPERFPARGLKERSTRLPRNGRTASDQDETAVGATGEEASVVLHGAAGKLGHHALDSICRTAVYVTRTHGGVGGGGREVFPYPELGICRLNLESFVECAHARLPNRLLCASARSVCVTLPPARISSQGRYA